MRRYTPLRASEGTRWPLAVRRHVAIHQGSQCIGPAAGMTTPCSVGLELDHIRASHATGKKSDSVSTNAATLCNFHHREKGEGGKFWRPRLIEVVDRLSADCSSCEAERIALRYRVPEAVR